MTLRKEQLNRVQEHLLRGERVLDVAFPARISLARWYVAALALLTVSVLSYLIPITFLSATAILLALFIGAALVMVVIAELKRHYELLVITNVRVFHVRGLLSESFTDVVMDQITDTSYKQHLVGRIFRFGTLTINTAGSPHAEIVATGILYPDRRKRLIDSAIHMRKARQDNAGRR